MDNNSNKGKREERLEQSVISDLASPIIVALDFDDIEKARALVRALEPSQCRLKVGKEMFTLFGPDWVRELIDLGFDVFLDLKFHDIPTTVAKACKAAADLGVWMVNVHAVGGKEMMSAALEAVNASNLNRPLLTAVTILTSMNDSQYSLLGYERSIDEQVKHLAGLAHLTGLDGIVCSALEAADLRKQCGDRFKLVTPGIRPAGAEKGDQSRVMTPKTAILNGASYLVIGRPITQSRDPHSILCEISDSLVGL